MTVNPDRRHSTFRVVLMHALARDSHDSRRANPHSALKLNEVHFLFPDYLHVAEVAN